MVLINVVSVAWKARSWKRGVLLPGNDRRNIIQHLSTTGPVKDLAEFALQVKRRLMLRGCHWHVLTENVMFSQYFQNVMKPAIHESYHDCRKWSGFASGM